MTPSSVDRASGDDRGLARVLGLGEVLCFGLGNCLGAGIYVTVGTAMVTCAGPAISVSFVVGGFSALMTALCYAELASQPELANTCGSAYTYGAATLGPLAGLLCGWYLSLGYLLGAAAVARGWAHYMQVLLGPWGAPGSYLGTQFFKEYAVPGPWTGGLISIEVAPPVLCVLLTCIALTGTKVSAHFNMLLTVANLLVILVFVAVGLYYFDSANMTPFTQAPHGEGGFGGIVAGAGLVYFAFLGYDAVTALAGETKEPGRIIPKAVILTVLCVTAVYTACAVALAGMMPSGSVSTNAPLTAALVAKGASGVAVVIGFGAVLTSAANAFCALIGQPRIWFAMARDGLLPDVMMRVSPGTQVPVVATALAGAACTLLSGTLEVESLIKVTSASSLMVFNVVAIGLCRRRMQQTTLGNVSFARSTSLVLLSFLCGCLALGFFIPSGLRSVPTYTSGAVCFLAAATVCALWPWQTMAQQAQGDEQVFVVPGGPLVPLVAVLVNSMLLGSLGIGTLTQLIVWTLPALVFYLISLLRNAARTEQTPIVGKDSKALS